MIILVDTNVIIDALAKREPFAKEAQEIIEKCAKREMIGCLAAHTIPNIFYILRKYYSQRERRDFIVKLCQIFKVTNLDMKKIVSAVENEAFNDFEDCLQEECAVAESADYLVTRNPADFLASRVKVVEPGVLLNLLKDREKN